MALSSLAAIPPFIMNTLEKKAFLKVSLSSVNLCLNPFSSFSDFKQYRIFPAQRVKNLKAVGTWALT